MLLQLLTSVTAAASSQHGGSSRQAAGAKQRPAGARAIAGSSNSSAKGAGSGSRLHMQLQAALCHVRLNMERPYWLDMSKAEVRARAARERKEKQKAEQQQTNDAEQEQGDDAQQFQIDDTPLRTKDLLALLVLGTNTSVRKLPAAASSSSGRDGTGAAAGADVAQPGMEVAFCVAHIGLQDLRACVEQRHVLSGALEPYQVRKLKTDGWCSACMLHRAIVGSLQGRHLHCARHTFAHHVRLIATVWTVAWRNVAFWLSVFAAHAAVLS
jgi:hypothetical protein